jgi:ubiquinone/menaquinone biosynthesis C-methylase UbiE
MKKQDKSIKDFWNKEYAQGEEGEHFALSDAPGKDFVKFVEWLEKIDGKGAVNKETSWLDVGCGNGRHGLFLYEGYGAGGLGYDLSSQAVSQANKKAGEIKVQKHLSNLATFKVQNINLPMPLSDDSVDIVIDAMASHVLHTDEHEKFLEECNRVLKYKGYIFLKTFLLDDDDYARDLVKKFGTGEEGGYLHPKINIFERVLSEKRLVEIYSKYFNVEKIERSHFHREKGKRRYIVMYLRKV